MLEFVFIENQGKPSLSLSEDKVFSFLFLVKFVEYLPEPLNLWLSFDCRFNILCNLFEVFSLDFFAATDFLNKVIQRQIGNHIMLAVENKIHTLDDCLDLFVELSKILQDCLVQFGVGFNSTGFVEVVLAHVLASETLIGLLINFKDVLNR